VSRREGHARVVESRIDWKGFAGNRIAPTGLTIFKGVFCQGCVRRGGLALGYFPRLPMEHEAYDALRLLWAIFRGSLWEHKARKRDEWSFIHFDEPKEHGP
jgi:hypothetical protein